MKRILFALIIAAAAVQAFGQGNMTPPPGAFSNGTPVAVMKTLDQIEPRSPIKQLPAFINKPGSYYLTGTLTSAVAGITIDCDDVKIDLGGFAVEGKGSPPSGGIYVSNSHHNISIRNGVVRGWGANGICAGDAHQSEVVSVTAFTNGNIGIDLGENALIQDCGSFKNGAHGIVASSAATVRECKTRDNTGLGIFVGGGGKISGCVSGNNGSSGVYATMYCGIMDCTVTDNGLNGIVVDKNCRVTGNSSGSNTSGAGILIRSTGNRIVGNNVTDNKYGIFTEPAGTNNLIVRNTATGNTTANYSVDENNAYGRRRLLLGEITTTTGPWANFSLDGEN